MKKSCKRIIHTIFKIVEYVGDTIISSSIYFHTHNALSQSGARVLSFNLQDKHAQMNAFLQSMKDPNSDQQKQIQKVLLGGRGQQKRLYSVDETIYGTEEGAKLQQEAQQKAMKKKKNRRDKETASDEEGINSLVGNRNLTSGNSSGQDRNLRVVSQSVAAVAVVGALAAAGASFLLGGKRS